MPKSKKQVVHFYCSGAMTAVQENFVKANNAQVHQDYTGQKTGRHVFARAEVNGFDECPKGELLADLLENLAPVDEPETEDSE